MVFYLEKGHLEQFRIVRFFYRTFKTAFFLPNYNPNILMELYLIFMTSTQRLLSPMSSCFQRWFQNYARLFPGVGKSLKDSPVMNYNDPSLIKTDDLINMMPPEISDSLPKVARPPSSTVSVRESAGPLATIRVKSFEGKLFLSSLFGQLKISFFHESYRALRNESHNQIAIQWYYSWLEKTSWFDCSRYTISNTELRRD